VIQEWLRLLGYGSRKEVASMKEVGIGRERGERCGEAGAGCTYVTTKSSGGLYTKRRRAVARREDYILQGFVIL
jgi:hypothetical protein